MVVGILQSAIKRLIERKRTKISIEDEGEEARGRESFLDRCGCRTS